MSVEGDEVTQILDVDPDQLAQLLSQSADGTAQLIDEHGNTITLTADHFSNAGLNLAGNDQLLQLQGQYIQGEDGQIYLIEEASQNQDHTATNLQEQEQLVTPKVQIPAHQQDKKDVNLKSSIGGDQNQQLIDEYQRLLQERETRLNEIEQKLKETTEQNVIMAHALVSTCKSQEVEVVVNADGTTNKRQVVSVRKSGPGEMAPHGSYLVTGEGGGSHIVTAGQGKEGAVTSFNRSSLYRRSNDAFQIGFLPFPCDQCPRRFAQENHLKRHLEMAHAKRRPFYCQYCNRDLYLASDLHFQGHMRMQHKQEMEHEANLRHGIIEQDQQQQQPAVVIPQETFEAEQEPNWESGDKEPPTDDSKPVDGGDFKCTLCNKEYASMNGLKKHAKDEHSVIIEEEPGSDKVTEIVKTFVCDVCQKSYSKLEYLDKHKIAHSDHYPFPCQYCAHKRFKWKENLLKHLNWHMERMPFKCTFCNQGFPSQIRLDLHQKTKHGHSKEGTMGSAAMAGQHQRDHACPVCQKTFFDKEVLAKHMRIHGGTVFPCPECDKKFISEKFLRNHMTVHTQIRDFTCEKCGKFFNSASLLKAHRYLHGERPYKCRACLRTFRRAADLKSHEKLHTERKSFICDVCGRNFRSKVNLDLHLRVHQGLKPFQCSSCRKTFGKLQHLQVHVNAHKGIKPHPCPKCDSAFSTQAHLEQHLTLHQEGRKPFQCGACGQSFIKRQHLVKHLKSHTTNAEIQYVVIWEKGGALQEAVIVTDGVAQDASNRPPPPFIQLPPPTLPQDRRLLEDDSIRGIKRPAPGMTAQYKGNQDQFDSEPPVLQLMDERRAPAEHKTLATVTATATPTKAGEVSQHQAQEVATVVLDDQEGAAMLDPQTLLALAEAQDEDGTIYISEENLQALAEQGVVFTYQD